MKLGNLVLVLFILGMFSTFAQTMGKEERLKAQSTREVQATVKSLFTGMVHKDSVALDNMTLAELTYGHSSGTIEDKKTFIDAVINGPFDYISIDALDQTITFSGNLAMVRHIFLTEGNNDGDLVEVRIGNFMIFRKHQGEWKLLARQAYKL